MISRAFALPERQPLTDTFSRSISSTQPVRLTHQVRKLVSVYDIASFNGLYAFGMGSQQLGIRDDSDRLAQSVVVIRSKQNCATVALASDLKAFVRVFRLCDEFRELSTSIS
nr:hypothetical protein [Ferrimicrobium sp.]